MPGFLAAVGSAIGGYTGAVLIMYAVEIAQVAVLLGTLAYSSAKNSRARRAAREQFNASQVDRLVTTGGTGDAGELVLGRVRKSGFRAFHGSTGADSEKYVLLLTLARHPIDGVEQIYLNDEPVTVDGNGYVLTAPYARTTRSPVWLTSLTGGAPPTLPPGFIDGTLYEESHNDSNTYWVGQVETTAYYVRIRAHLGDENQLSHPDVSADFPGLWGAGHRLRGTAHLQCEFWFDEAAFPSGVPVVSARIRGARCYDPRTGLTAWTENPAIHMAHVALHPEFGKRDALTAAELAHITAAANACDIAHDYGAGPVPLYRSGCVFPFGSPAFDAFDDLAQAMGGRWASAAGELIVEAGVYVAPVLTLTEDDLATAEVEDDGAGDEAKNKVSISVHRARNESFNVVSVTIWDSAQGYKSTPLSPLKAPALISRDGAEIVVPITMPAVPYAAQALHIAGVMMRDARDGLVVELPLKPRAYALELFDRVALDLPAYGWEAKEFIVMSRRWGVGGALMVSLKETAASIYQPDAAFVVGGAAANTALPNPWFVEAPEITNVDSGTDQLLLQSDGTLLSRVLVEWAPINDASVEVIELRWRQFGVEGWRTIKAEPSALRTYVEAAQDGLAITIQLRARNAVAPSDWSLQRSLIVLGKTEPPPPFDVFVVDAMPDGTRELRFGYTTTPTPLDWAGAEVRYVPGNSPSAPWETATKLQEQDTFYTSSPIERNAPLAGLWTFFCRSRDTSKLLSTAKVVVIDLPARRTGNVFDEWVESELGWPGVKVGCVVNGDEQLEAIDATTWDTFLAKWEDGAAVAWNQNPASPITYTVTRDFGTVVSGSVNPEIDAEGDVLVELATSDDGVAWSAFGDGAAAFSTRYVRVRLTVTATIPQPIPLIRAFDWQVNAPLQFEYVNNVDLSALVGDRRIGVGDVRVPISNAYNFIKRVGITIEDGSAGAWTYQRLDNLSTGPRFQFKLNGTLADPAAVDFYVEGL
jgi:hypothetical protein